MPEHSHLHHPDVHMPASQWSENEVLHVCAFYSNPFRWRTRRELANDFRRHMARLPNVELHFGELAYGDRPFEVTGDHPNDKRWRTRHELFHKENGLNLLMAGLPSDWKYGAILDADFHFTRHDIALETIHQLQHYDFVQMFSSYMDLSGETVRGEGHVPIGRHKKGFVYNYVENDFRLPTGYEKNGTHDNCYPYDHRLRGAPGATGGAWAFRRSAWETVGGLLDRCIMGSNDWFMAFGLVGDPGTFPFVKNYTNAYREYIETWQNRAALLKKNVGYVDGFAIHHFHGPKTKRAYGTRDKILVDNQYDPNRDVFPDWQGVLQLTSEKPRLRDEIRRYFITRSEDVPHLPDEG